MQLIPQCTRCGYATAPAFPRCWCCGRPLYRCPRARRRLHLRFRRRRPEPLREDLADLIAAW